MIRMVREVGSANKHVGEARATSPVVAILTLAFALATLAGCARQAETIPRIGFLSSVPSAISDGFREGLKEVGLVEGSNITIEWRWTEGKPERITELARELVALKPGLIVTTAPQPTVPQRLRPARSRSCSLPWATLSSRDSSPVWPAQGATSPGLPFWCRTGSPAKCSSSSRKGPSPAPVPSPWPAGRCAPARREVACQRAASRSLPIQLCPLDCSITCQRAPRVQPQTLRPAPAPRRRRRRLTPPSRLLTSLVRAPSPGRSPMRNNRDDRSRSTALAREHRIGAGHHQAHRAVAGARRATRHRRIDAATPSRPSARGDRLHIARRRSSDTASPSRRARRSACAPGRRTARSRVCAASTTATISSVAARGHRRAVGMRRRGAVRPARWPPRAAVDVAHHDRRPRSSSRCAMPAPCCRCR